MGPGNKFFEELKRRCGLSEKHIMVLKSLRNGDLSAKKISSKANIPLGRLYEYLNELLSYGLIEKRGKKPCLYSINDMDEKVRNFMKKRFDNVVADEKIILEMLQKQEEKDYIEVTRTKEEFTYSQLKMLSACKKFYTFCRFGSIALTMYPSDYNDFFKFREIVAKARPTLAHSSKEMAMMVSKAHTDAYKNGKSLIAIVCKKTFNFHIDLVRKHLGEEFLLNMISDLKQKIKKYNLKIYLREENFPMQIFLNEDTVYLAIIHNGSTFGTIIHNKDVRDMYLDIYEDMIERSQPIEKYLKEIMKK